MTTKAGLISQITSFYKDVGTPVLVIGTDSSSLPNINRYRMPVLAVGISEKDKQPLFADQEVVFCVYKEGDGTNESAYLPNELINSVDKDVTITDGTNLNLISKLYNSEALQDRVLSAIIIQCTNVFLESPATTNHANRMKLVNLANCNLSLVVMQFMCAIAQNSTVQSNGNNVSDSVIQSIVTGAWDSYASLIVA